MKELPNVTLIAYDNSDSPAKTLAALQYCASVIAFGAVVMVCRIALFDKTGLIKFHMVGENGYAAAMDFEVMQIHKHVETDFALFVSSDGYILNPGKWNDQWLNYDFIGAPWPASLCRQGDPSHRVGNTGFCLKSKAFMQYSHALGDTFAFDPNARGEVAGDVFTCRTIRPKMEAVGIKFAPLDVAADFSWELYIEEYPQGRPDAFGFHNFDHKTVPTV